MFTMLLHFTLNVATFFLYNTLMIEKRSVKIMKKVVLVILLVALISVGCNSSPNVDRVEKINGENVKILKSNGQVSDDTSKDSYSEMLESITMLQEGHYGFYLNDDSILILQEKTKYQKGDSIEYSFVGKRKKRNNKSFEDYTIAYSFSNYFVEGELFNDIEEMNVQLSPDREKLLHVVSPYTFLFTNIKGEISKEDHDVYKADSFNRSKGIPVIPSELKWVDNSHVFYRNVNDYYVLCDLDDYSKTQKFVLSNLWITGLKQSGLIFNSIEVIDDQNSTISVSDYNSGAGSSEILNFKSYEISPDNRYMALYFESKEGSGKLYMADFEGDVFTNNFTLSNMVLVIDVKVIDMQWNEDSSKLACSTEDTIPGLFVLTLDETIKQKEDFDSSNVHPIVINKRFENLNWNKEGDSLLCVEEKEGKGYVYEIKLK